MPGLMKAETLAEQIVEHCSVLSLAVMIEQQLDGGTVSYWGPYCPSFHWEPGYCQDTSILAREFRSIASYL